MGELATFLAMIILLGTFEENLPYKASSKLSNTMESTSI